MNNERLSECSQGPVYSIGVASTRLCTISACFLAILAIGSGFAAPTEDAQVSGPPLISLDAILERKASAVRFLRWYDFDHLTGEFTEPESGKTITRLISIKGAQGRVLGEGKRGSTSPDGRMLLQQSDDGWLIRDLDTGENILIETPPEESREFSAYSTPVWSRDGRYAAIVEQYRPSGRQSAQTATEIAGVLVIDVGSQAPVSKSWVSRITIIDRLELGATRRILVNDMALQREWGPDNTLFVSQTNFLGDEPYTAVLRIQPGSQKAEEIYRSRGRFQGMAPAVNADGTMIALVLDVDNRTWSDFQSILLIDPATGKELHRLTHDLPVLGWDYVWSHEGEAIYARVRNGGLDQIYAIPLDGMPRQLTQGVRRHFDIDLSPDGQRLSYRTEDGYGRKDFRVLDLETGVEKVVLVLDEPAKEFKLGEWHHIRWMSTNGVKPFGFLFLPPDFDPDRQYPMIVDVHGGGEGSRLMLSAPLTVGVARGPLEWHVWAALGYIVFVPDYRSTGGYGPKVIADRYKAGEIATVKDIEDIVSGTRHVIEKGFVDPSRVAILGHSAGGARVYILLTKYGLYAAAILNEATSPDPVSNFINLASGEYTGGYPAGIYRQYYGGTLADVADHYKRNYMLDSHRNKTPTLIMVGNEALGGVSHMPNEVLYSILNQQGVPTRMLKFMEEGHNYSRPEAAKLAFEEIRCWLKTHMPNRRRSQTGSRRLSCQALLKWVR